MDEAEGDPEHQHRGSEKQKLAQSRLPVAPMQVEIKSRAGQTSDSEKRIQARIHQQQIIHSAQASGPRHIEPAQIHRQTQGKKNDRVAPVAALLRIGDRRPRQQPCHHHWQSGI